MVVTELLPYRVLVTENPSGKPFAQEDDIGVRQLLLWVSAQHLDAHRAEKEGVGGNLVFSVQTHASVIKRRRERPRTDAGCRLHLLGEVLENGTNQRAAVLLLGLELLSVDGEDRPCLIQVVVILEAGVEALLIRHTREEEDAHRQSQSQGDDFDDIGTTSSQ